MGGQRKALTEGVKFIRGTEGQRENEKGMKREGGWRVGGGC